MVCDVALITGRTATGLIIYPAFAPDLWSSGLLLLRSMVAVVLGTAPAFAADLPLLAHRALLLAGMSPDGLRQSSGSVNSTSIASHHDLQEFGELYVR